MVSFQLVSRLVSDSVQTCSYFESVSVQQVVSTKLILVSNFVLFFKVFIKKYKSLCGRYFY